MSDHTPLGQIFTIYRPVGVVFFELTNGAEWAKAGPQPDGERWRIRQPRQSFLVEVADSILGPGGMESLDCEVGRRMVREAILRVVSALK